MNRKLAIFAAVIAAFAINCQSADAKGRHHHHHMGKKLTAVSIGVGAASTAAYFGLRDNNGFSSAGAWAVTTVGCAAVSPIVATVVLNRPLTQREAHILVGSCVIPIVGGWLVNQAYIANPQWESGAKHRHHHHHGMKHHHGKMKM